MADESRPPESAPDDAAADHPAEPPRPALGRITRVRLKNYKSIVSCDVQLEPLTLLVGPNGSGKSNFLDALAFVSEALTVGLDQAILKRGNLDSILSAGRPPGDDSFSVTLEFDLGTGEAGSYGFEISVSSDVGFTRKRERLDLARIVMPGGGRTLFSIDPEGASMWGSDEVAAKFLASPHQLSLTAFATSVDGRPAYDLLSNMVFYNPQPDIMRDLKRQDTWPHLRSDGSNVASMLRRMQESDADLLWGVTQYMKRILPGLESIRVEDLAGRDLLRLTIESVDGAAPLSFDADQLSDGTLRALAMLVALFQGRLGGKASTSLVGIEEPENSLHPGLGGALANALLDASYDGQVLATTHGMSLLDGDEIEVRCLRAVVSDQGRTVIGPVDSVSIEIIRDHLYTAGELLQQGQLRPESAADGEFGTPNVSEPMPAGR